MAMKLTDRRRLARLIEIKGCSRRDVAAAAGWRSHTYLLRLLSGDASTCTPEAATLIAAYLEVPTDVLFVPRVSGQPVHGAGKRGQAA